MTRPDDPPCGPADVALQRMLDEITSLLAKETGGHPGRMARYARAIAERLAPVEGLSTEFVERIYLFAPLHDIGKEGIPDTILLKPTRLTPDERRVMNDHVEKGSRMLGLMIDRFGLHSHPGIDLLRNIVAAHHELLDGSGYPLGLAGDAIPLEARIVTVADIFDALTSRRSYKPAWPVDEALAALRDLSDEGKVDGRCVGALVEARDECAEIIRRLGGHAGLDLDID